MFRNKNSLGCHMWRFHKEAKDNKDPSMVKNEANFDPNQEDNNVGVSKDI